MKEKAYMIQVGATLEKNHGLSPIFEDKTFEYIPCELEDFLNTNKSHNHRHYSKMNCQNKNLLDMHMSSFVQEKTGHVDPEFYNYTYGESDKKKIKILKKLGDNSILIFTSLLQKYKVKDNNFVALGKPDIYIIGYFFMDEVNFHIKEVHGPVTLDNSGCFAHTCNEHIIYRDAHLQQRQEDSLLLIKGDPNRSCLFRSPLKVGKEENLLKKYLSRWGIKENEDKQTVLECSNVEKVLQDLQEFSTNNRWIDWKIP